MPPYTVHRTSATTLREAADVCECVDDTAWIGDWYTDACAAARNVTAISLATTNTSNATLAATPGSELPSSFMDGVDAASLAVSFLCGGVGLLAVGFMVGATAARQSRKCERLQLPQIAVWRYHHDDGHEVAIIVCKVTSQRGEMKLNETEHKNETKVLIRCSLRIATQHACVSNSFVSHLPAEAPRAHPHQSIPQPL